MKLAIEPNVMSAMMLGIGLTTFETTQPTVTPTVAGHANAMESGIRASAILTCTSWKLIGAKTITRAAYKAAKSDANAMFLVFVFSPPYSGVYMAERVEGEPPLTRQKTIALALVI